MVFSLRKSYSVSDDVILKEEGIEQVSTFRFLGVIIDSKLCWSDHIQYIKKKISKGIGILHKAKKILRKESLLTLYNCFIYPYIIYCIEVWGAASLKNLTSVLWLQKRAVRLITSSSFRAHSEPLFCHFKYYQCLMCISSDYQLSYSDMKIASFRIVQIQCLPKTMKFMGIALDSQLGYMCQRVVNQPFKEQWDLDVLKFRITFVTLLISIALLHVSSII